MDVAIISNLQNLELSYEGDIDLVEANWVRGFYSYRRFYARRIREDSRYVILDNSNWAGQATTPELYTAISGLKPAEVVAPDQMQRGRESFISTMQFLVPFAEELMNGGMPPKIIVVPQGRDQDEWVKYYEALVAAIRGLKFTSQVVIGVPKWLDEAGGRLQLLQEMDLKVATDIQHHLLGGGRVPLRELEVARTLPYIRSIDTSAPVRLAMDNKELTTDTDCAEYFKTPFPFTQQLVNPELARRNITTFMEVAHGVKPKATTTTPTQEGSSSPGKKAPVSRVREVPTTDGGTRTGQPDGK